LKKRAEGKEEIPLKDWSAEALVIDKNTEEEVAEKKW
jgi:hypothetical protein